MPKYTVLKAFKNLETDEVYEVGQEIELTEKRGSDVIEKLEEYGGNFLDEIGLTDAEIKAQQEKEKEAAEAKAKAKAKEKAEKDVAAEKKKADAKSEKDEK